MFVKDKLHCVKLGKGKTFYRHAAVEYREG